MALANGAIDLAKLPIEFNFNEAVSGDARRVRAALSVLESASYYGRRTASVFLMGLLASLEPEDWATRIEVAEALKHTKTKQCASLLFAELRRVKSTNTTRRYLDAVIDVLHSFPEEIVRAEFERLAKDTSFSPKMRKKFRRDEDPVDPWW